MKDHKLLATVQVPKALTLINIIAAVVYFIAICVLFKIGNPILFTLLIIGEAFHLFQAIGYAATIWELRKPELADQTFTEPVDIYITVVNEPVEIVEQTVRAALDMDYPNHKVWIMSDAKNAGNPDWKEYEDLAKRLGAKCVTHTVKGGAKAGNINKGLKITEAPFIVIFDADHIPHPDFLRKTMGYFVEPKVGFVQSPQYYKNHAENAITAGAWEQQEIFFGPILQGKQRVGAAFMCGTNMVLRRSALMESGGMNETSIAEDFLTSLYVHANGYKSVYVPEVLAEGLAPEDFLSYYKQQFRWARGSLEVIFKNNPLGMKGLSGAQKFQYLASASYYLNGPVTLVNALFPVVFFFTGAVIFQISTMLLAAFFLPYILLSLYLLQISSNFSYTYRALSFSMGSFWLQIQAVYGVITGQKTAFAVTSKTKLNGSFPKLAAPHIIYVVLVITGLIYSFFREGLTASYLTNAAWAVFNVAIFWPFIAAAIGKPAWIPSERHIEDKAV